MTQRNLFEVMGIEPRYHLSQKALEERYLALSKELHPDRFAKSMPRERTLAVVHSTELNDAYRVLRDEIRRAEYLLKLEGIDVREERPSLMKEGEEGEDGAPTRPQIDPAFLMSVMELREALAEARMEHDDPKVNALAHEVHRKRDAARASVGDGFTAYERGDRGLLQEVARALVAIRYYDRFLEEVEAYEEERLQSSEKAEGQRES
jgi:molecular chaperone HscB